MLKNGMLFRHCSVDEFVMAGIPCTNTLTGSRFVQGVEMTGVHGAGHPMLDITAGLVGEQQMPNGITSAMGLKSLMFAMRLLERITWRSLAIVSLESSRPKGQHRIAFSVQYGPLGHICRYYLIMTGSPEILTDDASINTAILALTLTPRQVAYMAFSASISRANPASLLPVLKLSVKAVLLSRADTVARSGVLICTPVGLV